MYSFYYKGLRLGVTFQVKHLCVGDFASFAKIFADLYFGRGIDLWMVFLEGSHYNHYACSYPQI